MWNIGASVQNALYFIMCKYRVLRMCNSATHNSPTRLPEGAVIRTLRTFRSHYSLPGNLLVSVYLNHAHAIRQCKVLIVFLLTFNCICSLAYLTLFVWITFAPRIALFGLLDTASCFCLFVCIFNQ